jgi:hypothetical protein
MAKPPRQLIKQVENFEEIIDALNGLIDGSKIKLQYYDQDFFERLTTIRKNGLELRDEIQIFKNDLEQSLTREYSPEASSRFAAEGMKPISSKAARKVVDSYMTRTTKYE